MAAPESSTLENMTGRWVVDKSLSDDFGAFLKIQGIPWWKRQVEFIIHFILIEAYINLYFSTGCRIDYRLRAYHAFSKREQSR